MIITAPLSGLLLLLVPLALAIWVTRRFHTSWRLVGIGVLTFLVSQVVHLPLLSWLTSMFQAGSLPLPPPEFRLLFNAVLLGLLAGLCEETARLAAFSLLKDRARSWASAVALGIGHGGVESIIIGVSVLASVVAMVIGRSNPAALNLPADQLPAFQAQLQAFWASPWYDGLAGLVERLGAISLHIAMSVVVLQTFLRRSAIYYVAAVLWHALVDGVVVYLAGSGWGVWAIEAVVVLFGLASLGLILALRRDESARLKDEGSLAASG